ncbi:MAG TPA: hypothetical protein VFX49_09700 [Chloroflexota bacterium]|nr:hypothetical protein [Chloroflexota bacterium]
MEAVSSSRPLRSRYERRFQAESAEAELDRLLAPLAQRLRWQRTIQHAPRGLLVGALVALAFTVFARLGGLPGLAYVALPFALIVSMATVAVVANRAAGPFEVARRVDASLGLGERIATALELRERGDDGPLVERQYRDAREQLLRVDAAAAFPLFARGSLARHTALRSASWGGLTLALTLGLLIWPQAASRLLTGREGALALADPGRREEDALPRFRPDGTEAGSELGDAMRGQTQNPEDIGEGIGLLGPPQTPQQAQQGAGGLQDARREAADQQNPNVAERRQALDDLGNALRQSQTGRQAGEALRTGDTERAAQQLQQLADQARNLSPGERQSLAQAFSQASQQIGDKDRQLADAARRAAEALQQFRNQEAQQAIRDAAAQVRDTGQQLEAQRQLESRQEQLQSGGQPSLPQLGQQAGQGSDGQGEGQRGQQSPTRSEAGSPGSGAFDLSQMEQELQNGGLQAGTGGSGAGGGNGAGSEKAGAPTRLNVTPRLVTVEAEVREGPSNWRPPNPNAAPAVAPPPAAPLPGAAPSSLQVASGLDMNAVPSDMTDSVRQYFSQDQPSRP